MRAAPRAAARFAASAACATAPHQVWHPTQCVSPTRLHLPPWFVTGGQGMWGGKYSTCTPLHSQWVLAQLLVPKVTRGYTPVRVEGPGRGESWGVHVGATLSLVTAPPAVTRGYTGAPHATGAPAARAPAHNIIAIRHTFLTAVHTHTPRMRLDQAWRGASDPTPRPA